MIVPMIWSVAWDVTRGGWLGPTMVLWCHWRLGGTMYVVWLFGLSLCYLCLNVMWLILVHCDVFFSFFPLLLTRWLDFASVFLSFSFDLSVHASKSGFSTPRCGGTLFHSFLGLFLCFMCVCWFEFSRECISSREDASLRDEDASLHMSLCTSSHENASLCAKFWCFIILHWKRGLFRLIRKKFES